MRHFDKRKWELRRRCGRWHYFFFRGVFPGLLLAALFSLCQRGENQTDFQFLRQSGVLLIIGLGFGSFFGFYGWRNGELMYNLSQRDESGALNPENKN